MNLAEAALKRVRFTIAAAVALVLAGIGVLLGFPATEEPSVPFRSATVEAYLPGAPTDRIEDLVARPLEERIRTIAEVKAIETTVRPSEHSSPLHSAKTRHPTGFRRSGNSCGHGQPMPPQPSDGHHWPDRERHMGSCYQS